jgi:hypothetical protein
MPRITLRAWSQLIESKFLIFVIICLLEFIMFVDSFMSIRNYFIGFCLIYMIETVALLCYLLLEQGLKLNNFFKA